MKLQEALSILKSQERWANTYVMRETAKVAVQALEKQIPKKPIGDLHSVPHYRCPMCKSSVKTYEDSHIFDWCTWCGQALDWSEDDE